MNNALRAIFRTPRTTPLLPTLPANRPLATMTTPILRQPLKLALIQLATTADKASNLSRARAKVLEAASSGAKLVVLPECFNSPYGTAYFPSYAENLSPTTTPASPSYSALSEMARDAGVYLVGGSVPELEEPSGKIYNTSLVFSPAGALLARHRKVHLFDIDIPGKIAFRESDVLTAGDEPTIVEMPEYGRIMVTICYDMRFPELAAIAARRGCFALVSPGAFNTTTGPLHWELLARARAVDNQMYVVVCSPARDPDFEYQAYGHSLVADPSAKIVVEAAEGEETVYWEMRGEVIEAARAGIPVQTQRRFDVYPDVSEKK